MRVRRPILADLQERPAELVELPDDLVDQVEPPRRQHDRPFGAFAIQLEQPDAALSAVRGQVDDVVEGDLRDRLAEAPDDRAVSRVDDPFHAWIGLREGVVAVEAQLVVVRIGAPDGSVHQPHVALVDVRPQVLGRERAVRTVRLDAPDVLAASLDDGVRKRAYVRPDVDDDVVGPKRSGSRYSSSATTPLKIIRSSVPGRKLHASSRSVDSPVPSAVAARDERVAVADRVRRLAVGQGHQRHQEQRCVRERAALVREAAAGRIDR